MLEQVSKRERLAVLKLEGLAQLAASPPQKFSWILEGWFGGWRLAVVLAVFFFFFLQWREEACIALTKWK
jgi:hypothetical protein